MPNVVDANPNDDDIGLLRQNIFFEPKEKVVNFVAADARADELVIVADAAFVERGFHSINIAAWIDARLRYRIAEKNDFRWLVAESKRCKRGE